MNGSRRFAVSQLAALALVIAGCGGTATDETVETGSVESAARQGGTTSTSPASVAATPNPGDRNGSITISFNPGAYASQKLFVKWQCYQSGAMLAHDGSFEFHQAIGQLFPGYAQIGDHFDWTFVPSESLNFALGAGPANCNIQGWYQNRKLQWYQIASGTFDLQ